jgi:hypothetical protein
MIDKTLAVGRLPLYPFGEGATTARPPGGQPFMCAGRAMRKIRGAHDMGETDPWPFRTPFVHLRGGVCRTGGHAVDVTGAAGEALISAMPVQ